MQIKIRNENGCAVAEIVNPATEECASTTKIEPGQNVTMTLPDVHEASGIEVGEVSGEPAKTDQPDPA